MTLGEIDKYKEKIITDVEIKNLDYKIIGELFIYFKKRHDSNFVLKIFQIINRKIKLNYSKYAKEILEQCDISADQDYENNIISIAKEILGFYEIPKKVYKNLYEKAQSDIETIKAEIARLNEAKEKLKDSNGKKVDELNYENYLLQSFIERDMDYISDIQNFLYIKINGYVLEKCLLPKSFLFLFDVPYSYAWWPNPFSSYEDIRLINKFRNVPIHIYKKIKEEYKSDRESIYDYADNYIKDYNIKQECLNKLDTNHILNNRKEVLVKCLNYFEKDNFVFCNLTMSQIEGLFFDFCLEFGKTEKELYTTSISAKAKILLEKKLISNPYYDYYSKVFPICRNRLMHGVEFKMPFDNMAKMILLDLYHVLELSESEIFKFNILRKEFKKEDKDFISIVKIILLMKFSYDDFYNFNEEYFKLLTSYDWEQFFIDLNKRSSYSLDICKVIVIELKKRNIKKEYCIDFLKENTKVKEASVDEILDFISQN